MKYITCFLIFFPLLLVFHVIGCKKNSTNPGDEISYTNLTGEYLGQEPPGIFSVRFAPEVLSANENWFWHSAPAFSPDGNEMYFTKYVTGNELVEIHYMRQANERWTVPERIRFSNGDEENYPLFSADGSTLFFLSAGSETGIFSANRTAGGWSESQRLDIPTPYSMNIGSEFSVTRGGNIYFELTRDIYFSEYSNGTYGQAVRLNEPISTEHIETGPYIDPDEKYLIFGSYRPGGYGQSDLYICFKNNDGTWTEPFNMGANVNYFDAEIFPLVSPEGSYLFFLTTRPGDDGLSPYWVDAGIIDELDPHAENSGPLDGRGGGIIAFTSDRDGSHEIYVMNADGSEQTRITNNSYEDFAPAWSPDGSKLAFSSSRSGGFKTYIMDVIDIENGQFSEPYLLVDLPGPGAAWSPDGEQIAFLSQYNSIFRIFLVNIDGSNLHIHEDIDFAVSDVDWSADGSKFAVTANNNGQNIGIVNIDGSNFHFITSEANCFAPAWSPDGSQIAFNGPGDGNIDIYVINTDGTDLRRITTYNNNDEFPSWSPDGSKITYESERNGFEKVYIINTDGTNPVRLTNSGANDGGPDWRPVNN